MHMSNQNGDYIRDETQNGHRFWERQDAQRDTLGDHKHAAVPPLERLVVYLVMSFDDRVVEVLLRRVVGAAQLYNAAIGGVGS